MPPRVDLRWCLAFVASLSACEVKDAGCPEGGCTQGDTAGPPDSDADTDADTDIDTSRDTDTDTDTAGETDTRPDTVDDTGTERVYTVCDDGLAPFYEIQAAIDAASEGELIAVCPGVYAPVKIDTLNLNLAGIDGAALTFIEGTEYSPAVQVQDVSLSLSGFTLVGAGPAGAALKAERAYLDIHDLDVAGGEGSSVVWARDSELHLDELRFEDNSFGASGLLWVERGSGSLRHCVFSNNEGEGSLLRLREPEGAWEITNSLFEGNRSSAGVLLQAESLTAVNLVFQGNEAPLLLELDGMLLNSIIHENTTDILSRSLGALDQRYNDLYDNTGSRGETGMHELMADPLFVDSSAGDYRLSPGSACVDGGDPDPVFNDVDRSRNDLGIFGGPLGDW